MPKDRLTGIGDVNLGAAIWLYNNDETRTYVAWEPFVVLPTGRYKGSQARCVSRNKPLEHHSGLCLCKRLWQKQFF